LILNKNFLFFQPTPIAIEMSNYQIKITTHRGNLFLEAQQSKDLIEKLEQDAGIFDAAQRAREGSLIPLGVTNPELAEGGGHHAYEFDAIRRRMRDLYFSIENHEVRAKLIEAQFRHHQVFIFWRDREIQLIKSYLHELKESSPLPKYSFFALVIIFSCWWLSGFTGALLATLTSFSIIWQSLKERKAEIKDTESELLDSLTELSKLQSKPITFEHGEMLSANRFLESDRLSAWRTHIQNLS
jgi:hypothetical protein